ncbi:LAMI_0G10836g1_1 [Lachancea mirantina]|uniref:DNA repair and recombination protein RAD52 n=1 Tax=Lachancea mirantina TaxID=1230905 RepID=A0A1G4KAS3_9SACH|nr:LAMI_0G10836g1_1 [Lachancea mirantina]
MDEKKSFSNYSEDIQAKLDKKLGPEYISKRVGFGASRVAYIEGWKAINLANQIFGYNGWSTEVKSVLIDFMDERQGKFSIGCTAIIRVTLTDGTFREDIGYGTVENERRKSSAFERAKKSAVTDALKRSLRAFGNALGNCLYDKDFLAKIDKVKFDPPDFDESSLYRAADEGHEPVKSVTAEFDSEMAPNKRRHPDGMPQEAPRNETRDVSGQVQTSSNYEPPRSAQHYSAVTHHQQDSDELLDDSFMFSDELQDEDVDRAMAEAPAGAARTFTATVNASHGPTRQAAAADAVMEASAPPGPNADVPITFVTAKAAPNLQNRAPVPPSAVFDPKFKPASIQHTVDQTTSTPIRATDYKVRRANMKTSVYEKFAAKGRSLEPNDTPNELVKTGPRPINEAKITNPEPQVPREKSQPPIVQPHQPSPTPLATPNAIKMVGRPKTMLPNLKRPI